MSPAGAQEASVLKQCSHIVARHHDAIRDAFPRIEALLDGVVGAHAVDHPELRDLKRAFEQFRAELEPHLHSEEELLFAACVALEREDQPVEEALRALLEALVAFESDLRRALDEESNLLFPHVRRMSVRRESELVASALEGSALPRCCAAWVGEQTRTWARSPSAHAAWSR